MRLSVTLSGLFHGIMQADAQCIWINVKSKTDLLQPGQYLRRLDGADLYDVVFAAQQTEKEHITRKVNA